MNKQTKNTALVFLFFVITFLFFYFLVDKNIDAHYLANAFRCAYPTLTGACIEGFQFSLLYYVTIPFFFLFGENAFLVLPLLLYFGGITFLTALFKKFSIRIGWLPILFCIAFWSISFIAFYMRDSLTFFLACAFAYWFFLAYYKKTSAGVALPIIVLALFFNTPNAIMFLVLYFLLLGKNSVFAPAILTTNVVHYYFKAINVITTFTREKAWLLILPFNNYLNFFSLAIVLFYKNRLLGLLLAMNVFVSIISTLSWMEMTPNPEQLVFRYGFVFVPLQMFLIAKTLEEKLCLK